MLPRKLIDGFTLINLQRIFMSHNVDWILLIVKPSINGFIKRTYMYVTKCVEFRKNFEYKVLHCNTEI